MSNNYYKEENVLKKSKKKRLLEMDIDGLSKVRFKWFVIISFENCANVILDKDETSRFFLLTNLNNTCVLRFLSLLFTLIK